MPGYESFSLLFQGPAEPFLPQAIYPLEHAQLGAFALFLVPVGKNAAGFLYEAVLNLAPRV
jgi:hypothetical protein